MRKLIWIVAVACCAQIFLSRAFDPQDYVFVLSATVTNNPPQISIAWPPKDGGPIRVRRKKLGDDNWGNRIATLHPQATNFVDDNVDPATIYEYEFTARMDVGAGDMDQQDDNYGPVAYGYIASGIEAPAVENRGKVALIVDDRFSNALTNELETLRRDLIADGWTVIRHDVSRDAAVTDVKALIQQDYAADPQHLRTVFLFGHIPVPYSGLLNPDMHPEHLGAWPADVYYGDMTGAWTDKIVDKEDSEFPPNINIPGDGKFDQSQISGPVQLEVGRVDLANLPTFGDDSELNLLRNYLRKDHEFRHAISTARPRGLIRDNFWVVQDDAPAADAWRAFPALFGPDAIDQVDSYQFFPALNNDSYLWAFGCGGGDRDRADGVGQTADFANTDPKAVFYMLHGSWFGDWNTSDNFLRASLAATNLSVVSIWSSLPHWFLHPIAMGETVGYVTRLVQNNQSGLYQNDPNYSVAQVHISMQGDPTLHSFVVAPPSALSATGADDVTLTWTPSSDDVIGYNIYVSTNYDGAFARLNPSPITATNFIVGLPAPGAYVFMVRAVKLQTTGSGSFYNLSQGVFAEAATSQQIESRILNPSLSATGDLTFQATGFPNRPYAVQSRTPAGDWQTRDTGITGNDGIIKFHDSNTNDESQWYRVLWPATL